MSAGTPYIIDEYGRPFIILREQASSEKESGLAVHKVRPSHPLPASTAPTARCRQTSWLLVRLPTS